MALIDFQTALGRLLLTRHDDDLLRGVHLDETENRYIEELRKTAGFRVCANIQRSWCIGRAAKSAQLTLSLIPRERRQVILEDWVDSGGGTHSFFEVEAESFLDFVGKHLSDPSHELTVCQFEQATLRANRGISCFAIPDSGRLTDPDCRLRRGSYAGLVRFYADPGRLLESLQNHEPLPVMSSEAMLVMFSPGLPQLWHEPKPEEVDLWEALASPSSVGTLWRNGHAPETVKRLLEQGSIEYADRVAH